MIAQLVTTQGPEMTTVFRSEVYTDFLLLLLKEAMLNGRMPHLKADTSLQKVMEKLFTLVSKPKKHFLQSFQAKHFERLNTSRNQIFHTWNVHYQSTPLRCCMSHTCDAILEQVVLMSATVKAEDFASYFGNVNGQTALKPACNSVARTGGGLYPLQLLWLALGSRV